VGVKLAIVAGNVGKTPKVEDLSRGEGADIDDDLTKGVDLVIVEL
jgi:hypothetical protein